MAHPISLPRSKPGRIFRGTVFVLGAVPLAAVGGGAGLFTVVTVGVWAACVAIWPQKG
jgi:hypothetical protein